MTPNDDLTSTAPERIWLHPEEGYAWKQPPDDKAVPYIRADLAPQWKPIAEAPKDGTRILGTSLGTAIHCYYWRAGAFQSWFIEYAEGAPWQPTHWMPLPAAPQAEAEEGGGDIDGMLRESSS